MYKIENSKYQRAKTPQPMRFQPRDGLILQAIHKYDGVLARRQIKEMFWPQASTQAMEHRLSALYHNGYLNWPDTAQRRTKPIPEPIVWLGWRGILHLAYEAEIAVIYPTSKGENQMRLLERRLREQGLRWQREPRWSQLGHDIAVNDFRMAIEGAASYWPSITLERWLPEGDFLTNMDVIEITSPDRERRGQKYTKGVRPDGFFVLVDHLRQINNSPARARFLLEFDNGTHPLERFGRDKALPGHTYIRSEAYKNRFGFNSGRWLVVCNGNGRLHNLKRQTENVLGANASVFLFTTMEFVKFKTVLNAPIWLRGGSNKFEPLVKTIEA